MGIVGFLGIAWFFKTGSHLRDSDCRLTFQSCDRQLLKSCFTQTGCCKRLQHIHRSSFNSLQAACIWILLVARCIFSNWGVSLRICDHTGFPLPSLSSIVSVAPPGYEDSSWRTCTGASVSWRPAVDRRWLLEIQPLPVYLCTCPNCVWKQRPAGTETSAAARRR